VSFPNQDLMDAKILKTYRITFGQKWAREPHPQSINGVSPHPNGWFEVKAHSWQDAQKFAMTTFRGEFAMCYTPEEYQSADWAKFFPLGKLGEI
jgi:hypothetical protein